MKKTHLIMTILAVAAVSISRAEQAMDQKMDQMGMSQTQSNDQKSIKPMKMMKKKKMMYKCPMDGTMSDKPGKCPKCGMDMEPVKSGKGSPTQNNSTPQK